MKNKLMIMAATVAALVSFSASVQAVPITGGISFTGDFIPNNPNLTLATSLTFGTVNVAGGGLTGANGSFTGLNGALTTMFSPLAVNPTAAPVLGLWSVGGFTFDAITLVQSGTTPASLTLTGNGTIKKAGFDNTAGIWIATFNTISDTFSFSASAGAINRVPDGGTTVMLLGAALSGLCLFRKKMLA